MEDPVKSNQVAHVLLDTASVFRGGEGVESDLAVRRLNEIDAVTVSVVKPGSQATVEVDISNFAVGAVTVLDHLVDLLSQAHGVSREEVIADARAYVDALLEFRT